MSDPKKPSGPFWSQLKPASYRGVSFGVVSGQAKFGRRNAVHEYPFRDTPWIEDLGRQARRITLAGFLIGDDVIARRDRLIAMCEQKGDGLLVHPTLGQLTVSLMEFTTEEHRDNGRVFQITFTFIEAGQREFPSNDNDQAGAISDAADALAQAAADRFVQQLKARAQDRQATSANGATGDWISAGIAASSSATSALNLAGLLDGNYGRRLGQSSGIPVPGATLEQLTTQAASLRAAVTAAAGNLTQAANALAGGQIEQFPPVAQAYMNAVFACGSLPANALQCMLQLSTVTGRTPGAEQLAGDLFRRLAVVGAAQASAAYQPSTSDEAVQIRGQLINLLDAETDLAGNQRDDGVYMALRSVRAQVTKDMNAKGASLPGLTTITTNQPLPALVLAQRLYRDPTRADELVKAANPRHPAFMPITFKASAK